MRWTFIATRLFMLALVITILWIGKDSLLLRALVHSGEATVGAKVEIGQVRASLLEGRVYLRDIAIADPRDPMQNLLQADIAYLQLNPRRLLHREFVIENGSASQVMFGVPRTLPGALDGSQQNQNPVLPSDSEAGTDPIPESCPEWLSQFKPVSSRSDLQSDKLSADLAKRWQITIEEQQQDVQRLKTEIARINQSIMDRQAAERLANPLRRAELVDDTRANLDLLNQRTAELKTVLTQLIQAAQEDVQSINQAKADDLAEFDRKCSQGSFDSELVSQQILQQSASMHATEIINWFRWFRDAVPDPDQDFRPVAGPGVDLEFAGYKRGPRLLIQQMELDGEGKIAGQHFNFLGTIENVSTEPERHDQPTTFHLRAQGNTHVLVDCVLDRRSEPWQDSLQIHCPNIHLPAQQYGNPDYLQVQATPCRLEARVNLHLSGNRLTGSVVFRHTDLMMQIEQLKTLVENDSLADEINLDLASIDRFEIRVELGGTLNQPEIQLNSDIGQRFAEIMNRVAKRRSQKVVDRRRQQICQNCDEDIKGMQEFVFKHLDQLIADLNQQELAVERMSTNLPTENSASPVWRRSP